MNLIELIELKIKLKKKKPKFLRQDAHKLHLPQNWRKPRGIHNKMRLRKKGHGAKPDSGYRSSKLARYLHHSNFKQVLITNIKDIEKIDPKKEAIILSKRLGLKKKMQIIEKCNQLNIKILNIKNPTKFLDDAKKSKGKLKLEKVEKEERRKKAKEELVKKSEEKQEKELTKEEKKEEEKELEKKLLEKEHPTKKPHDIPHEKMSDKTAKVDSVRTRIPTGGDRSV